MLSFSELKAAERMATEESVPASEELSHQESAVKVENSVTELPQASAMENDVEIKPPVTDAMEAEITEPPSMVNVQPEEQSTENIVTTEAIKVENGVKFQESQQADHPTTKQPTLEPTSSPAGSGSAAFAVPTRQYLDQTVVPILLHALSALARERPVDPIQYLADHLLRNKERFSVASTGGAQNEVNGGAK
ncbi:Dosage compensation protein dpy-30 [Trichinella pseudospiralis]|uniref:Dosage compensation protein dpy-30 n=1 Tax=Trichinella pseudospiralis TaxID=6337 RepID=A0A0V1JPB3_TRIPS|nr:Dosage compensation protein dpy-30 [Trichinella pseudospiralis]